MRRVRLAGPSLWNSSIDTHAKLQRGLQLADKTGRRITYRYGQPQDDMNAITAMLHEAYAPLAQQGLRFVATHQDSETTRRRMNRGETIVALNADEIVGTIRMRTKPTALCFTTGPTSRASGNSLSARRTKELV